MGIILLEASARALALAGAAGLVDLFVRRNTVVRHLLWTTVLVGMLALPLLRPAVPPARVPVAPQTVARISAVRELIAIAGFPRHL